MELHHERLFDVKERIVRKWMIPWLVVVVAIGFPAVWFGPRVYSYFNEGRLLRRAQKNLEKNEIPDAAISLRRVLELNPGNVEAVRLMANLADQYAPGEAPALRERACQLAPGSYDDASAWALTALRVGQTAQAEEAFELMKKLGKRTADFDEIGARVALAAGRIPEARAGFERALAVDPASEKNQLQLALIDIRSPDAAQKQQAREALEHFRSIPHLRHTALQALVGDRLELAMYAEALTLATDFVSDAEATFPDRLQYLGLLRAKEDPSFRFTISFSGKVPLPFDGLPDSRAQTFASYLNELEAEAGSDARKAAALIEFLNGLGLSLLACEWTRPMAREFLSVPPVAVALAEAYRKTLDWRRLEELTAEGDWGASEFLRFAFGSRVAQEKGDRAEAEVQWAKAVTLSEYRVERLAALGRMASAWGWSDEFEGILWTSARNSKRPRQALDELLAIARAKRDTSKLFTIWSQLLELDPEDVTTRKNWVRLSFLTNNDRLRTGMMARELYLKHPEDPEIATTYATILHFRLQDEEALAVMKKLTPEQLRDPAIAGYYGIILFANQRKAEAAECFVRSREAALLREEMALIDEVRHPLNLGK